MLNKLKSFIKKGIVNEPFDASRFNDPLALTVAWNPLKPGGSNFKTHKLVPIDYHRIEFQSTLGAKIFSMIFAAAGLFFPVIFMLVANSSGEPIVGKDLLFLILFSMIFVAVGIYLFFKMGKPVVFDKWAGFYWKGRKRPDHTFDQNTAKDCSRLGDIYAIQLLSEYIRSDKSSYYSYELNLVLKNGSRLNVIDHGNDKSIRDDAKKLSEFLGKPIWDAI